MDSEEVLPMPKRRRRVKVGEEPQVAFVAGEFAGTEESPEQDPRSLWLNDSGGAEAGSPFTPTEEVPGEILHEVEPTQEPASRDIGNWRYTPWRGLDMWSHSNGRITTFDERIAKKFRHDASPDASAVRALADRFRRRKT